MELWSRGEGLCAAAGAWPPDVDARSFAPKMGLITSRGDESTRSRRPAGFFFSSGDARSAIVGPRDRSSDDDCWGDFATSGAKSFCTIVSLSLGGACACAGPG